MCAPYKYTSILTWANMVRPYNSNFRDAGGGVPYIS